MKRSQQSVPGAMTGSVSTDDGFSPNSHKQSIQWKNKGGRNATTNAGMHGSGLAPKPSGGAAIKGNDRPSMPAQGGLARVSGTGKSATGTGNTAGSFTPVQNNANANQHGRKIGQSEASFPGGARVAPKTPTAVVGNPVATNKPKRRGLGAAFYGEY